MTTSLVLHTSERPIPPVDRPIWQPIPGAGMVLDEKIRGSNSRATFRSILLGVKPARPVLQPFGYLDVVQKTYLDLGNKRIQLSRASLEELVRILERYPNETCYHYQEEVQLCEGRRYSLTECIVDASGVREPLEYLSLTLSQCDKLPPVEVLFFDYLYNDRRVSMQDSHRPNPVRAESMLVVEYTGQGLVLESPIVFHQGAIRLNVTSLIEVQHLVAAWFDSVPGSVDKDIPERLKEEGVTVPLVSRFRRLFLPGGYELGDSKTHGYEADHYAYHDGEYRLLVDLSEDIIPQVDRLLYLPGLEDYLPSLAPRELWRLELNPVSCICDQVAETWSSSPAPQGYCWMDEYNLIPNSTTVHRYRKITAKSARSV